MAITDPRAIKFTNEAIRPLAERLRDLKNDLDDVAVRWNAEIAPLVPNDTSVLEDGRAAQGDSVLTGADITNFVTVLLALKTRLGQSGVADVVSKPTVRAMRG